MTLAVRDDALRELMDDADCDPARLAATLRRFGTINRLVSGWGRVYRTRLAPYLAGLGRPARVLDLGSGGGDLVVRLSAMAHRDGLDARWVGADPDPRAHAAAVTRDARQNVEFRCLDAAGLRARGERFDVVLSNHVLHHLDTQLASFLNDTLVLASGRVLHSDIARSRRAYALYAVGITPWAPGTFLRTDGLRSIRRSFTPAELQAVLDRGYGGRWRVDSPSAFRLLAEAAGDA